MSTRCVSISELIDSQVRSVSFSASALRFSFTPCIYGTSSESLQESLLGSHPRDIGGTPSGRKSMRCGWLKWPTSVDVFNL
jgi:hypothetical protein